MFGSDLCTISYWNVVPCTRVLHDLLTFSLPIMSMWSFFISLRQTLIPFRLHFESCWYSLSARGDFLYFLCIYQCILCIWVIIIGSIIIIIGVHPNLVTTFRSFLYLISSEKSRVKSQVRDIKIACLAAIYVPFPIMNMVSSTQVLWLFDPPPLPTSIAL